MNNENLTKKNLREHNNEERIQEKEKWWKEDMRIKTQTGVPDLPIFLLNASLEKNSDWIHFVMLNISKDKEENKVKLLRLFFMAREFPSSILKKHFPKEAEMWAKLKKSLDEDWIVFSEQEGFYQYYQLKKTKFRLLFNKYRFNGKNEKNWKEWETLSKASFAYNFHLLGEVICNIITFFSEAGKIEKLPTNEEAQFKIEFDIDPENIPDILITPEKDKKEKLGIEVVEVSSLLVKKYGNLEKFVPNRIENHQTREFKKQGKGKREKKPLFKDIEEIEMNEEQEKRYKEELKKWVQEGGKNVFSLVLKFSKKINKIDYLIKNLKETIKKKNEKWEKKNYKNFGKTALWSVLSASFSIYLYYPSKDEIDKKQEIQKDFFSWFLLRKLSETLTNIEIKFSYLIITFLNIDYCDESSFLNKHDPFVKEEREMLKEKSVFLKYISSDNDLRVVAPNFYIPVKNGKIRNLEENLKEMKKRFEKKWGFDINSIVYEEFGLNNYTFYAQNLENKKND